MGQQPEGVLRVSLQIERERLANLPEDLREPVARFWARLQALFGEGCRAWTIFGPAASGTYDPLLHQAQSVLVLDEVNLDALRQLAGEGERFGRLGLAAPLIMTPRYIDQSRDTFPLELLEIQQAHVTVWGEEFFEARTFEESHVRLECEREGKALLIAMRQGLLASGGSRRLLTTLEESLSERILRVMRGMLWLKGTRQQLPPRQIVRECEELLDRKLPGIRGLVDLLRVPGWDEFKRLYDDVVALSEHVNAW